MARLCIIGPVTRDIVRRNNTTRVLPGGVPIYAGVTAKNFGLDASVVTKLALDDVPTLCKPLADIGVNVQVLACDKTTEFKNLYDSTPKDERRQYVTSVSDHTTLRNLRLSMLRLSIWGP